MAVSLDGRRQVIPLLLTAADEDSTEVSLNGRWMAYSSDESGRRKFMSGPFPTPIESDGKCR